MLTSFANHPYIDIRVSFNSFIPVTLSDELAGKLVEFCMKWLKENPHLHDKVEFDVIPTSFDLNFSRWEKRFVADSVFSLKEVDQIRTSLLILTNKALQRQPKDFEVIEQLEERYQVIKDSCLPPLEKAFAL